MAFCSQTGEVAKRRMTFASEKTYLFSSHRETRFFAPPGLLMNLSDYFSSVKTALFSPTPGRVDKAGLRDHESRLGVLPQRVHGEENDTKTLHTSAQAKTREFIRLFLKNYFFLGGGSAICETFYSLNPELQRALNVSIPLRVRQKLPKSVTYNSHLLTKVSTLSVSVRVHDFMWALILLRVRWTENRLFFLGAR